MDIFAFSGMVGSAVIGCNAVSWLALMGVGGSMGFWCMLLVYRADMAKLRQKLNYYLRKFFILCYH